MNGGCSVYHNPNMKATGANIKSSAGKVLRLVITNSGSAARFIKLYDKATAPTVGTDTPVMTIGVLNGLGPQSIDLGQHAIDESGVNFVNGIGIGATTVYTDADNTAPTDGDVQVNVIYK